MKKRNLMNGNLAIIPAIGMAIALTACGSEVATEPESAGEAQQVETTESEVAGEKKEEVTVENTANAEGYITDSVIATDLIQVTIPDELKGMTYAKVEDDRISVYDKALVDAGWPGLVFEVGLSSDCNIFAGGMFTKVGEVFATDGTIYNVGRGYASEIQWDYNEPETPESYTKLLDATESIFENITGTGDNLFVYKAGTKGEDLYFTVLDKYVTAISEGWDANKCEEEGISPEIAAIAANNEKPFEVLGYAYADMNCDGIEDLFIGDMSGSEIDGMVYDVYSTVDRVATHIVTGTARDRYYAYGGYALLNEFSGGAMENGSVVWIFEPNSTDMVCQLGYKYDAYTDEKNPWFSTYDNEEWTPMSEEDYKAEMERIEGQKTALKFTPFTTVSGIDFSKEDMSKYATFTEIVDSLYPNMAYANVTLDETDVLLVANGSYDNLDGNEAAIDSSVFMYDKDGNVVFLGTVQSGGTANPLAVKDGKLLTAGHHFVTKNTVKDGKLVAEETAYEEFDTNGNATYYVEADGEKNEVEDDKILQGMFAEYSEAEIVNFQKIME